MPPSACIVFPPYRLGDSIGECDAQNYVLVLQPERLSEHAADPLAGQTLACAWGPMAEA